MSTLTVKEMREFIDAQTPSYDTVQVGDLEFHPIGGPTTSIGGAPGHEILSGGAYVVDRTTGSSYSLPGEGGLESFCKYLGVPAKFILKLPDVMQGNVVNHFIAQNATSLGVISHVSGETQGVYKPTSLIMPPKKIAEMVSDIFKDTDIVAKFNYAEGLAVNIYTPEMYVDVRTDDRTSGGIRFEAYHGNNPRVSAYMERLICTNGMVATSDFDTIGIKGYSLDEIITNMKSAARLLLDKTVPAYLDNWKKLTTIRSTNPEQLIHRLVKENDISSKIESRIIEAASSLENDSYYDVVNLVTSFQHENGVDEKQFDKIQVLGGNAVRDLGGHRCTNCQHNLEV